MDRRTFFTQIIQGASAAAIALHVSPSLVFSSTPKPYLQGSVSAYMTKLYNEFCKATGKGPHYIEAGKELFEAFNGELKTMQRFTDPADANKGFKTLAFKSCRMRQVGEGWGVKFYEEEPTS